MAANLASISRNRPHKFITPAKRINEGHDVPAFLTSQAYRDIGIFIMQLNIAMCPRKQPGSTDVMTWKLDSPIHLSEPVRKLQELLERIASMIEEAPPDSGPRRFGNVSFRKWYEMLEARVEDLLKELLPQSVLDFPSDAQSSSVLEELTPYLLGGFGSAQRLDYGTGHELSFVAFLGCLWKLGAFAETKSHDGAVEREIVFGVIEPYLRVVRRLILTYTLEPAGSHGVWGLDDHSFVSYIFGSAQYCTPITENESMPVEGSLSGSPNPGDVAKKNIVDRERQHNMYFSAIGFINDVKTGPFWEHSPILFDISGVRSGWGKINKGMIKMFNAEVLSKFPVVQHFPFGSLFSWDQDSNATPASASVHTTNQPTRSEVPTARPQAPETTKAPWATSTPGGNSVATQAPWVKAPVSGAGPSQRTEIPTRVPWANSTRPEPVGRSMAPPRMGDRPTTAPWAKKADSEAPSGT